MRILTPKILQVVSHGVALPPRGQADLMDGVISSLSFKRKSVRLYAAEVVGVLHSLIVRRGAAGRGEEEEGGNGELEGLKEPLRRMLMRLQADSRTRGDWIEILYRFVSVACPSNPRRFENSHRKLVG